MFTEAQFRALMLAQVGKSYVLGAKGPSKFDCSGLCAWGLTKAGRKTSGCAADLYKQTKAVSGSPKVGDLVFLLNNITAFPARVRQFGNRAGHVAIITAKLSNGDYEIVEARNHIVGVVKTTLSYWKKRSYYGGVRRFTDLKFATADATPAANTVVDFRLVAWNILGRRYDTTKSWPTRKPRVLNRLGHVLEDAKAGTASVLVLTECGPTEAKEIAAHNGYQWVNFRFTTIMWDPKKWTKGDVGHRDMNGTTPTHGAVWVELTRSGHTINVVGVHLPPNATRASRRKTDMAGLLATVTGWNDPTIIAGDLNDTGTLAKFAASSGFASARTAAASILRGTYRTHGVWGKGNAIDWVLTKGLTQRGYRLMRGVDPATGKKASDHHMLTVQLTAK